MFGNEGGYRAYFVVTVIFGVIGAVIAIAFNNMTKKAEVQSKTTQARSVELPSS
jgi:type II secretory pathway pseudopilin PulG